MKLNKDKQIPFQTNTVFEGYDAKISSTDMHKLWDLLQNPYKNPIGAIVREYVSNSFDAHEEANFIKNNNIEDIRNEYSIYQDIEDTEILKLKENLNIYDNDAVHVSIAKDQSGWYWSTEDFGVGLSMERVKDVFCSYLKSTKEDTNNVIGAFGIGSKSGLSYTDVVYIRTRYNGIEYQYLLRKGEKSPRLDKILEETTEERNGTQIKIYLKETKGRWGYTELDDKRFKEECEKQLAYFDNVYFSGCGVRNDYKLIQGDVWKKNNMIAPFSGLHMCVGKVAYPIDWDTLGIKAVNFPVALKFKIGELDIIQTREDVKYTPKTKQVIFDKIEMLKKEWTQRWEKENDLETDDFLYYLKNINNTPIVKYEEISFNLLDLFESEEELKWFEFMPFKDSLINIPSQPFFDYESKKVIRSSGLRQHSYGVKHIFSNCCVYRIKDKHNSKKSKYIYHKVENKDVYLIRKKHKAYNRLFNYVTYLGLKWEDRAFWRKNIILYQDTVMKTFLKFTKSYDRVEVDKIWLKTTYDKSTRVYDNTKIIAKELTNYYSQGRAYNYIRAEIYKKEIEENQKRLKIVGTHDDRYQIRKIALLYEKVTSLTIGSNKMKVYTVAPTNMKYFKNIKNTITMKKFISEDNKIFRKAMTCLKIQQDEKFQKLSILIAQSEGKNWENIYSKLADNIKIIEKFLFQYKSQRYGEFNSSFFTETCYNIAVENNWFDESILDIVNEIINYFNGLDLLYHIDYKNGNFPTLMIAKYIRDYNKANRNIKEFKKINSYYYVMFNNQEQEWLKDNKEEYKFIQEKQKQINNLKKVS